MLIASRLEEVRVLTDQRLRNKELLRIWTDDDFEWNSETLPILLLSGYQK